MPTIERRAYSANSANEAYMFQIIPVVTSIMPQTGWDTGGSILTLTGTGFPVLPDGGTPNAPPIEINLSDDLWCAVLTSTRTTMTCRVIGPMPERE